VLVSQGVFPTRPAEGEDAAPATQAVQRLPGRLLAIDIDSMTLAGVTEVGTLPLTVRASGDGRTAFVANLGSGTVTVIDLATMSVSGELDNNAAAAYGGTHGMCWVP
jgi:DNA-binding beta-propeller fold protein YncE